MSGFNPNYLPAVAGWSSGFAQVGPPMVPVDRGTSVVNEQIQSPYEVFHVAWENDGPSDLFWSV